MRGVIQKVRQAHVEAEGQVIGQIDQGILVLLGITHDDTEEDMDWLIKKMTQLRIFPDEGGKMNLSLTDVGGGILVVSQFTLYANCKKGNRPSYTRSAPPDLAEQQYERFLELLGHRFEGKVQTGKFGAMMEVHLLNDGPVTIVLDSRQRDF